MFTLSVSSFMTALQIGQVGLTAFLTCSSMQIWHPEWPHFKLTGFNIVTKQIQHCNLSSTEPVRTQLKATADADCKCNGMLSSFLCAVVSPHWTDGFKSLFTMDFILNRLLYRVVNSENQHLWLFWVAEMSSSLQSLTNMAEVVRVWQRGSSALFHHLAAMQHL